MAPSRKSRYYSGKLASAEFRTERARKAAAASNGAKGVITRFLALLPELTPEQIETVRRALPPVEARSNSGANAPFVTTSGEPPRTDSARSDEIKARHAEKIGGR